MTAGLTLDERCMEGILGSESQAVCTHGSRRAGAPEVGGKGRGRPTPSGNSSPTQYPANKGFWGRGPWLGRQTTGDHHKMLAPVPPASVGHDEELWTVSLYKEKP